MKTVLITGGSRGIGKACADKFRDEKFAVLTPTRDEMDLSSEQSIKKWLEKNSGLHIDILINDAGINEVNDIDKVDDADMDKMFAVNLKAPILLLRHFIPQMKAQNFGRIVNIGSVWAVVSKQGRGIYSATKNALHGITNTVALEVASHNILVNTVCPGFVMTELTQKNNTSAQIDELCKKIPLGRLANPEEIANFVWFLCSDMNTYITGQKFVIDGGYTIQ